LIYLVTYGLGSKLEQTLHPRSPNSYSNTHTHTENIRKLQEEEEDYTLMVRKGREREREREREEPSASTFTIERKCLRRGLAGWFEVMENSLARPAPKVS